MKKTLLVLIALVTVSSCVKSIWGETTHDFFQGTNYCSDSLKAVMYRAEYQDTFIYFYNVNDSGNFFSTSKPGAHNPCEVTISNTTTIFGLTLKTDSGWIESTIDLHDCENYLYQGTTEVNDIGYFYEHTFKREFTDADFK
jgi:hypothetical protein|tara:strand:+ start:71 stop:493 length:423 start_codon:yes stop_codon:yes gene_type:complete